jgi:phenylalanyl-tRNA synthetase beta chain
VHYRAADPDSTEFVPLGMERPLSLRKILTDHPKGQDFGWIVQHFPSFPFLTDDRGDALSFPPVINSASLGAVQVGDEELFIELTGTDLDSLLIATSVVACDLADSGFTILPVKTRYPYETKLGREIVSPFYFQEPISLDVDYGSRLLGLPFSPEEAASCVARMGCPTRVEGNSIRVTVPEYRNDFLHPVDVVEDVMMGKGLDSFEPSQPGDFTVGRVSEIETVARQVKNIMVGLGYQEMIFNYLGSGKDYRDRMGTTGNELVRVANPMSENYEYVRSSILPALLASEAVSANAAYPHQIFEVGKIARLDARDTSGTVTRDYAALLSADRNADFNAVRAHVAVLFYYLSVDHTIREIEDPRFIPGRAAELLGGGRSIGVIGEIHPQVLENWGIQMPCAVCEIDVSTILELRL